jgi:hypothetical protein
MTWRYKYMYLKNKPRSDTWWLISRRMILEVSVPSNEATLGSSRYASSRLLINLLGIDPGKSHGL